MSQGDAWMIYGANGFTGRLIARKAKLQGSRPVLAGRSAAEVRILAEELGFDWKTFACTDVNEIAKGIQGMSLVLHCAGPFSSTSSAMAKACMLVKAHYLDITGEIAVLEKILSRSADFARAGIVAIPGVGFDVVPSDCLALKLKEALPGAKELELILNPRGGLSPGTIKTMLEGFPGGTVLRRNGHILALENFVGAERVFHSRRRKVLGIAWGDVASAFYSTMIPNIRVWTISSKGRIRFLQFAQKLALFWRMRSVQSGLKWLVKLLVKGPSEEALANQGCEIWATVRDGKTQVEGGVSTPNGYVFTADSALAAVRILRENPPAPGAYTPSMAFGWRFVESLPGVKWF